MFLPTIFRPAVFLLALSTSLLAQTPNRETREWMPAPFDQYLNRRVTELSGSDWRKDITAENWPARKEELRDQLRSMLGLNPWPERGELKPVITGQVQGDGYVVEKLQFQSSPGLYVTANFYRPTEVKAPLPTVLYVCGHANVVEGGVSMGNKTGYHHHGVWFAQNGYTCLTIDTIQLGEIRGDHHGTFKLGRWWWASRGYTPAGVEAWNGIRALDYLETRPEVDRARLGVTGRSGGGAYSWWIAALDERIKVAAPTAGITNLRNHLVDGCIEGHCDCMFQVNTERWDYDRVAALLAPRPLLIANTDRDGIFPIDGVMDIYQRTRALYRQIGKEGNIGLHVAEGPHKDLQTLHLGAFEWFNRFLKNAEPGAVIEKVARKVHEPRELKVFAELPADERVTRIDESFVPAFQPPKEAPTQETWAAQRDSWLAALKKDCFRAWPKESKPVIRATKEETADKLRLTMVDFSSEEPFDLRLWILHRDGLKPEELDLVVLNVLDDEGWQEFGQIAAAAFPERFAGLPPNREGYAEERNMLLNSKWGMAYVQPRGSGAQSWSQLSEVKQRQMRRRLMLVGETLESGQVWDIRQAAAVLREVPGFARTPLWLQAQKEMAVNTLYASLFIPEVKRVDLHAPAASHRGGPTYLNVLRHLDVPQAVAMAAERSTVAIYTDQAEPWKDAQRTVEALGWGEKRLQIRKPLEEPAEGR